MKIMSIFNFLDVVIWRIKLFNIYFFLVYGDNIELGDVLIFVCKFIDGNW